MNFGGHTHSDPYRKEKHLLKLHNLKSGICFSISFESPESFHYSTLLSFFLQDIRGLTKVTLETVIFKHWRNKRRKKKKNTKGEVSGDVPWRTKQGLFHTAHHERLTSGGLWLLDCGWAGFDLQQQGCKNLPVKGKYKLTNLSPQIRSYYSCWWLWIFHH